MDARDLSSKVLFALQYVEELSCKKKLALLDCVDEPEELADGINKPVVYKLLGEEKAAEFYEKLAAFDKLADELAKREIHWITYLDAEYPTRLNELFDKPILLFAKGNVSALNADSIAVVGTRRPTRYGSRVAQEFAGEFAKAGLCVISGLARGVDGIAHKACIDCSGTTIAVFASGLDIVYPAEHRGLADNILANGGTLVSEYPVGTKPLQYHFPERNRIVSGLARAVFLPQAAKKSGSLITMRLAIEQGRDIFAVPSNVYDEESAGNNELLREMPHALVISPEDVLDAMRVAREVVKKQPIELSLMENAILEALHDDEKHFEELIEETSLGVSELTNLLFNLEIEGLIVKTAGNYYALA